MSFYEYLNSFHPNKCFLNVLEMTKAGKLETELFFLKKMQTRIHPRKILPQTHFQKVD